jgi:hypothetical protein
MKNLFIGLIILFALGCSNPNHFINDADYLNTVKADFKKVRELASQREKQLFRVFEENISLEEKEALMFLYAYMPLNDLADYNSDFFLNNVRLALKTKETFNWVNEIPEDIFRHFVLPYRVNNENLDTSRSVFFKELNLRLKGMDLKEAILEVNHWCHEKVNYQGTDDRTISPLGAIKSTYGRCGEESTFTVAAMRAAGIPARQCYTPRWAHTDDNHAWVEVWLEGEWHYLGACEPEADLDIAWFSGPALRAMLVNSNVFGKYTGPEETIRKEEKYTKVNMLSNYAPVKTVYAKVVDEDNVIVKDATVEFQLYNYTEYYPIAKKQVNEQGLASLMTGFGDLLIWAYKENKYAYQKVTIEQTDTIILQLHAHENKGYTDIYDIIPPIQKSPKATSSEGQAINKIRLAQEDSIRNAYANTFIDEEEANTLALKYQLKPIFVWSYLKKSRGNHNEIEDYIKNAAKISRDYTISLLDVISPKDLRDGESEILLSHVKHSFIYADDFPNINKEIFVNYILNPRIENEMLTNYKAYLQNAFSKDFIRKSKSNIKQLVKWINNEITINNDANYYNVPITAKGVFELKVSDEYSRDLFFVAACRSFGIPARLEPATKIPQYFKEKWITVNFKKMKQSEEQTFASLKLINAKDNNTNLKYRVHFSLSKFEEGKYHTLDYGWDTPLNEMDDVLKLETGNYLLITGNRQANGTILTNNYYFNLKEGENKELIVKLRQNNEVLKAIGHVTMPSEAIDISGKNVSIDKESVCIVGFIDPEKEPTKHTLVDIEKFASSFNNIETNIYLFVNDKIDKTKYNLPAKTKYLLDKDSNLLTQFSNEMNKELSEMPVFMVIKNDQVYFLSQGYTIGIGEQMIKLIQRL